MLAVGLLSVALSANSIVFSAADSVVFHRVPYREPDRLVEIGSYRGTSVSPFLSAALLDGWRKQKDLFSGVQGYLTKTLFLIGGTEPDLLPTADITPGLIEMLGEQYTNCTNTCR